MFWYQILYDIKLVTSKWKQTRLYSDIQRNVKHEKSTLKLIEMDDKILMNTFQEDIVMQLYSACLESADLVFLGRIFKTKLEMTS